MRKLRSKKGQGLSEYAVTVLGVITVVIAILFATGAANPLSAAITTAFTNASTAITNAGS